MISNIMKEASSRITCNYNLIEGIKIYYILLTINQESIMPNKVMLIFLLGVNTIDSME